MTSAILPFPLGFSWLSAAARPSAREIETYAVLIAENEGLGAEQAPAFRREAELQLWVWRSETRTRAARRRRVRAHAAA